MLVSIIIPALNESKTILDVLSKCMALDLEKEIIVVDNNSTDGTYHLVREFIRDKRFSGTVHLLREPMKGKGAALKKGFEQSKGEIIVFQDADFEYEPASITTLVDQLRSHEVVFGCRVGRLYRVSTAAFIVNKLLVAMFNRDFRVTPEDILTGQRGFRRSVLDRIGIASRGFDVETELTIKTLSMGYRWTEVNVPYSPRDRKSGKKIGFFAFLLILSRYLVLSMKTMPLAPSHGTHRNECKQQNN
jgi:glycosyltransferase involved in cell wall biosynthesis